MKRRGRFDGYIQYGCYFRPKEHVLRGLDDILEERGLTKECENPEPIIAWEFEEDTKEYPHSRSKVLLYENSGDAFDPAVIFYRVERCGNEPATHSVHTPSPDMQQSFLEHDCWIDNKKGADWDVWKFLTDYIDGIINDESKWELLSEEPGQRYRRAERKNLTLKRDEATGNFWQHHPYWKLSDSVYNWNVTASVVDDTLRIVFDEVVER